MAALFPCGSSVPFSVLITVLFSVFHIISVNGTSLISEEEAILLSAKEKSSKHNGIESWTAGVDCTEWEGVTCDVNGHVVSIDSTILDPLRENANDVLTNLTFLKNRNSSATPHGAQNDRRRILSKIPKTISNEVKGVKGVRNKKLWETRAKINTIVGVMSTPTIKNPTRVLLKKRNGTSISVISPNSLSGCNVSPKWAAVRKNSENKGVPSVVVAIQLWRNGGWVSFCSGSLLNAKLVLTAAHCIYETGKNFFYASASSPYKILVKWNGKSDTSYSYSFGYVSRLFQAYIDLDSWIGSLNQASDIGVIRLETPLYSKTFRWASPYPSLIPRTNYGYPAITQDGATLIYDVTYTQQVTGCYGYSKTNLCEYVSSEPGMSGGPVVYRSSAIVLGSCSGGSATSCPTFYTGLTGEYALSILVTGIGCRVSSKKGLSRRVYTASC